MHLPKFLRTTSFRLTLLYAGLFSVSVLLLFAAIFWFATGYVAAQIDRTVSNEIAEIRTSAKGKGLEGLKIAVASYTVDAPNDVYYLLQDASGHVLAGNIPALTPVLGVRNWSAHENGGHFLHAREGIRGRGVTVDDGAFFFVGIDSYEMNEMREMIMRSFFWGIGATILLALAGGTIMSLALLRPVEAISQTSRDIIAGDLRRRMHLRGTDDEFDHLAASLNTMLDRIVGLMEGLQQVSSDIAHDLRTPLSRLRQRLELAKRRSQSLDDVYMALDHSIADVDSILETFAALLRIAQIEAKTNAVTFAPVNLSELLLSMIETYQTVAEERSQVLSGTISPNLTIIGDRELLPQLFSNLIENAIHHCPEGAKIELSANINRHDIEVLVSDNGSGIPVDMREKVFQRFFRLERSRTTPGTGLGLSLAAAIATLHDGEIALFDNEPGLKVRLIFPPIASDRKMADVRNTDTRHIHSLTSVLRHLSFRRVRFTRGRNLPR